MGRRGDRYFFVINIDAQDAQDNQDETLLQGLQPIYCKTLITIDLLRISQLQFPHYIPLFEKESAGPSRTLADGSAKYLSCVREFGTINWSGKPRVLQIRDLWLCALSKRARRAQWGGAPSPTGP